MAINLGAAYVDIVPSTSGLAPALKKELGDPLSREGDRAGAGFMARFSSSLSGLARSAAGQIGETLTSGLTAAAAAGAGLFGAALWGGFGRLTAIDDAQAKLRGLGHEAAAVDTIMESALASVRGTAFGLGDAAGLAATAVAAGIKPGEELTRYLGLIADTATIAGSSIGEIGSILNKTTTSGRVYTQELNQLADRGLPVFQWLQDAYGVTADELRRMVSAGEIDSARFGEIIEENIGGAALASGESFTGGLANVRAALGRFGEAFLTPGFEAAKTAFPAIIAGIDSLTDKVGPALERIGLSEGFANFFQFIGQLPDVLGRLDFSGLSGLAPILGPLAGLMASFSAGALGGLPLIGSFIPVIGPLVGILGGLIAASPALRDALGEAFSVFSGALPGIIEALTPAFESIVASLDKVLTAIAPVIPLLAELAVILIETIGVPVIEALAFALEQVANVVVSMGDAFPVLVTALVAAGAAIKAITALKAAWAAVTAVVAAPIVLVVAAIAALAFGLVWAYQNVDWFRDAVDKVADVLVAAWEWIVKFGLALWDAGAAVVRFFGDLPGRIGAAWDATLRFFSELPGRILTALGDLAETLGRFFVEAVKKIPLMIGIAIGATVAAFVGIPALILYGLWKLGNWLWDEAIWPLLSALPGLLADGIKATLEFFADLPGMIVGAIGDLAGFIWENVYVRAFRFWTQELPRIVVDLLGWFAGLPGLIVGALAELGERVKDAFVWAFGFLLRELPAVAKGVLGWFVDLPGLILDQLGDLGKILWDAGKQILEGLLEGMKAGWNAVSGWLGDVGGWITDLKGPIDYDARLLIPAGDAIMAGLLRGMQGTWSDVEQWLGGLAPQIDATLSLPTGAHTSPVVPFDIEAAGTAPGGGVVFESGAIDARGLQDPAEVAEVVGARLAWQQAVTVVR